MHLKTTLMVFEFLEVYFTYMYCACIMIDQFSHKVENLFDLVLVLSYQQGVKEIQVVEKLYFFSKVHLKEIHGKQCFNLYLEHFRIWVSRN